MLATAIKKTILGSPCPIFHPIMTIIFRKLLMNDRNDSIKRKKFVEYLDDEVFMF